MRQKLIELAEQPYLRDDLPEVQIGDQVSVAYRVTEGNKTRIQKFEGLVIAMKGTGSSETMTVRKIASGIGVERVFLLNSKKIDKIVVLATGADVCKSKLYYMRKRFGKKARIKYASIKSKKAAA